MAWTDWQNKHTANLWTAALDELQAGIEAFAARSLAGTSWRIERTAWDSPDITLIWTANGLERNVHLYLTGSEWPLELHYEGAAWSDEAEERNLSTWPPRRSQGIVPLQDMADLRKSLDRDLPVAVNNVNGLALQRAAGGQPPL